MDFSFYFLISILPDGHTERQKVTIIGHLYIAIILTYIIKYFNILIPILAMLNSNYFFCFFLGTLFYFLILSRHIYIL